MNSSKKGPGRPRRSSDGQPADQRLTVRLTPAELEKVQAAAGDIPVAQWAAEALVAAAS